MKATLKRLGIRRFNQRTALINQLRAILLERGNVGPQRKRKLEQYLLALLDEQDGKGLTPRMRTSIADLRAQWLEVDRRIAGFDEEFARFTHLLGDWQRPPVSVWVIERKPLHAGVARARSTSIADQRQAEAPCHQHAGNKYLRKLLIRCARAELPHLACYRPSAAGQGDCSPTPIRMSPSWPWAISWPALRGP
jgi:hypothetical protein